MLLNILKDWGTRMIQIILPLPNMKLSHNRSHGGYYGVTIKLKQTQRTTAYNTTLEQINIQHSQFMPNVKLKIKCYVYWHNNRRCDLSNILDAAKSQIDGIFLALQQDDYCIDDIRMIRCEVDKINPRLIYEISEIKEKT